MFFHHMIEEKENEDEDEEDEDGVGSQLLAQRVVALGARQVVEVVFPLLVQRQTVLVAAPVGLLRPACRRGCQGRSDREERKKIESLYWDKTRTWKIMNFINYSLL